MLNVLYSCFSPRVNTFVENEEVQKNRKKDSNESDHTQETPRPAENIGSVVDSTERDVNVLKELPPDNIRQISEILIQQDPRGLYNLELAYPPLRKYIDTRLECIAGVSQNGLAICRLSEEYRRDRGVVLAAIRNNALAFRYSGQEMRNDKEIVLVAVKKNGLTILSASEKMKSDEDVCIAAVNQNGLALRYVSKEMRNNKEVVLVAVKQNASALNYASEELKDDLEIVRTAIENDIQALQYASERFRVLQSFF